eukprot:snap_masked-scaffold_22-processed-gene-3.17-mRNA-1 protein AED:1.00 eAED:1.00 QI:0/0/0/0/1/1/2/0/373
MCLTNLGKTFPEEELCGAHGTCVEGICVCDTNWGNSIDLAPVLALNQGAREIFENATVNTTSITVEEFESLFINSSPCSRMIPFRNTLFSINFLFSLFAALYSIKYIKTKVDLKKRIPQIFSCLLVMTEAALKIVYQENISFPFSFVPSLLIGVLIIYFQISVYDFYCKYTKYHLAKARKRFGLKVKFLGINLENFLVYQIHYSKYYEVILYGSTFFIAPIIIQIMRKQNKFDFNLFLVAHKFIIAQWIIGFVIVLFLFLLTQAIFSSLIADFKALKELYKENTNYFSLLKERAQEETNSKYTKLEIIIISLERTQTLISFFVFLCIISYLTFFLYIPSQLWFQYIGPGLVAFCWPIILSYVVGQEERKLSRN